MLSVVLTSYVVGLIVNATSAQLGSMHSNVSIDKQVEASIGRAVRATAAALPKYEGVERTLRLWCTERQLPDLSRWSDGHFLAMGESVAAPFVESFIEAGFTMGEDRAASLEAATEILNNFRWRLVLQLLGTKLSGVVTVLIEAQLHRPLAWTAGETEFVTESLARASSDQAIEGLTRQALARELWGDPDPADHFDFRRNQTRRAQALAQTSPDLQRHLDAARAIVPDYGERLEYISPYGPISQRDWWVGIKRVTLETNIRIRNRSSEVTGVFVRGSSTPQPVTVDPLLAGVGYVSCQILSEEVRYEVEPGRPVLIPVTVILEPYRYEWSNVILTSEHALEIAQLCRAFAHYLQEPIEGIHAEVVLDSGRILDGFVTLRALDAPKRFDISEIQLEDLQLHANALDAAV